MDLSSVPTHGNTAWVRKLYHHRSKSQSRRGDGAFLASPEFHLTLTSRLASQDGRVATQEKHGVVEGCPWYPGWKSGEKWGLQLFFWMNFGAGFFLAMDILWGDSFWTVTWGNPCKSHFWKHSARVPPDRCFSTTFVSSFALGGSCSMCFWSETWLLIRIFFQRLQLPKAKKPSWMLPPAGLLLETCRVCRGRCFLPAGRWLCEGSLKHQRRVALSRRPRREVAFEGWKPTKNQKFKGEGFILGVRLLWELLGVSVYETDSNWCILHTLCSTYFFDHVFVYSVRILAFWFEPTPIASLIQWVVWWDTLS